MTILLNEFESHLTSLKMKVFKNLHTYNSPEILAMLNSYTTLICILTPNMGLGSNSHTFIFNPADVLLNGHESYY